MKLDNILEESLQAWTEMSPQKCKTALYNAAKKFDGKIFHDSGWVAKEQLYKAWDKITGGQVVMSSNEYYKDKEGNLLGKRWKGYIAHYPPPPKIKGTQPLDKLAKRLRKQRPSGSAFAFSFDASFAINAPGNTDRYEFNITGLSQIQWKDIPQPTRDAMETSYQQDMKENIDEVSGGGSGVIGKTILRQIKALDRLALGAWGAREFLTSEAETIPSGIGKVRGGLQMKVNGSKHRGWLYIWLTPKDTYTVATAKVGGLDWKPKKVFKDVYAEDLVKFIDDMVG